VETSLKSRQSEYNWAARNHDEPNGENLTKHLTEKGAFLLQALKNPLLLLTNLVVERMFELCLALSVRDVAKSISNPLGCVDFKPKRLA
jgi:hypothetical protein